LYLEKGLATTAWTQLAFPQVLYDKFKEVVSELLYRVLRLFVTGVGTVEWRKCLGPAENQTYFKSA
jgi:hypothetical protein